MIRRSFSDYRERIAHLEGEPHFHLHFGHMGDSMAILQIIEEVKPDEIYNLAAQSHVQVSLDSSEFTANVDATGMLRVLELSVWQAWLINAEFISQVLLSFSRQSF